MLVLMIQIFGMNNNFYLFLSFSKILQNILKMVQNCQISQILQNYPKLSNFYKILRSFQKFSLGVKYLYILKSYNYYRAKGKGRKRGVHYQIFPIFSKFCNIDFFSKNYFFLRHLRLCFVKKSQFC